MTKKLVRLALLSALIGTAGAEPARAAGQPPVPGAPFSFVVPVTLTNLHKNLTLLRVRCWVMPGTNWKMQGGALGEGVSGPLDTSIEGGIRAFSGDVTVNVPLRDLSIDASAVQSYRCQPELFDSAARSWSEMSQIDKRYPLDKESMSITETGGVLGQ